MTPEWTLADLAAKLREVAAERPGHVYVSPGGDSGCYYRVDGEPSCIFGHALDRLGVAYDPRWEGDTVVRLLASWFGTDVDDPRFKPFARVQRFQDGFYGSRHPWGVCVESLDEEYPLT